MREGHVSKTHALLIWRHGRWSVRDLASSNGTFVRGRPIDPGENVALAVGDAVAFGDPEDPWVLERADPPKPFAESLTDGRRIDALGDVISLPSVETPHALVVATRTGWQLEDADGEHRVADGGRVMVQGETWSLCLPAEPEGGTTGLVLRSMATGVSIPASPHDGPIQVHIDGEWTPLKKTSAHRVLYLLAREWRAGAGQPPDERGITHIDLLAAELGRSAKTVDVHIHRVRAQFLEFGIEAPFERRHGVGQLRLGPGLVRLLVE